jgi:GntR family transcriptional regulator
MQIAEHFYRQILLGHWKVDDKVPSVRQLAVDLEVNPNTVMRTYTHLQEQNIIYNQRGIGFYVCGEAPDLVRTLVKEQFLSRDLLPMFEKMDLLGMDCRELEDQYAQWKLQQKHNSHEKNEQ